MTQATDLKSVLGDAQANMHKAAESTQKEFKHLRTGRASIALVEGIVVNYYDTPTPLKALANISTPDAKTIAITPWDLSGISSIEKAILKSDLGLNPMSDGKIIRMQVPALTDERREDLSRLIKKIAEEGRVSVRNSRHEALELIKKLEKDKVITEDDLRLAQKEIQKFTDKHVKDIDESLEKKEKEIHEV
jgi:ribosome recycling factor